LVSFVLLLGKKHWEYGSIARVTKAVVHPRSPYELSTDLRVQSLPLPWAQCVCNVVLARAALCWRHCAGGIMLGVLRVEQASRRGGRLRSGPACGYALAAARWLNCGRCTSEVTLPLDLLRCRCLSHCRSRRRFPVPNLRAGPRLPIFPHLIVRLSLPPRLLVRHFRRGCRLSELKMWGSAVCP
jgi:hypothetical protein